MPLRAYDGVFAQVHGAEPPRVIALHGWGRRGSDFDTVLAGLDALAPDLPGFGATPAPAAPMGAAGYAGAITPVVERAGRPVVLVGHSFGGRVAVALAASRPDLVAGLVLTGVPLLRTRPPRRPGAGYRLLRAAHRMGLVSDVRMERVRRSRGSADYRAATGVMRDILVRVVNETYEEELGRISAPVAMVWGSDDREAPVEIVEAAAGILRGAGATVTCEILPGGGHMLPLTHPAAVRTAIDGLAA